jgi:hypothetical protein
MNSWNALSELKKPMNRSTREKLEKAGYTIGTADDFLGITALSYPPVIVHAAGTTGRLFPGQFLGTFCFVPDSCLKNGQPDNTAYIKSGWATRNARLNVGKRIGSHLFPLHDNVGAVIAVPKEFLDQLAEETP